MGFYYVNTEPRRCNAAPAEIPPEGMSPLVGDWVQVRDLGGAKALWRLWSRAAMCFPSRRRQCRSAGHPCFRRHPWTEPYLIDRIAAIAALKGCQVLLCLNKCDLNTADEL